MNRPRACVQTIIQTDPQQAEPLLDLLLWAVTPGTADSAEYDKILDDLSVELPEFRVWRRKMLKDRAAA